MLYSVSKQVIYNDTWCQERQNLLEQNGDERARCKAKREESPEVRDETRPSFIMQGNIPLPSVLNMSEGDVRENWRSWRQMWDAYNIVSWLREQPREYQQAAFIMSVGEGAVELYNTLHFESEEARRDLDTVLKTLEDHLLDTVNTTYERFCFNKRSQRPDE